MYDSNIQTRLDIMKSDLTTTVMNRQCGTKAKHCGSVIREFSSGDAVNIRDFQVNSEKFGKWTYPFTNWTSVVQG